MIQGNSNKGKGIEIEEGLHCMDTGHTKEWDGCTPDEVTA